MSLPVDQPPRLSQITKPYFFNAINFLPQLLPRENEQNLSQPENT